MVQECNFNKTLNNSIVEFSAYKKPKCDFDFSPLNRRIRDA